MAGIVGVRYDEIPIEPMFDALRRRARRRVPGLPPDATEENIQARIRGTLLMALSNKFGSIVLTTGNKSEMAVGYATLYGDMAGGFAVLKDISKTLVYRLSRYRNALGRVIPERIITRAPSAELRPDQTDQDSLPPYDVLDGDPRGLRRAGPQPGGDRRAGLRGGARAAGRPADQDQRSTSGGRRRSASASRRAASARTGGIRSRRRGATGRTCRPRPRRPECRRGCHRRRRAAEAGSAAPGWSGSPDSPPHGSRRPRP